MGRAHVVPDPWLLAPIIFLAAVLYTSVGHGGATAYLAILALADYSIGVLRPTILILNIVAAGLAFLLFQRAGHLRVRLVLPFLVTSVPFAYLGGLYRFDDRTTDLIFAGTLFVAAARLLFLAKPPRLWSLPSQGVGFYATALPLGAVLGFVAGATGIGGGIFLSPILLILGWADVKEAGSVAAAFIVLNSAAGLAAVTRHTPVDETVLMPFLVAVTAGALLGSSLGAYRVPIVHLQRLLGVVLAVAGVRALL